MSISNKNFDQKFFCWRQRLYRWGKTCLENFYTTDKIILCTIIPGKQFFPYNYLLLQSTFSSSILQVSFTCMNLIILFMKNPPTLSSVTGSMYFMCFPTPTDTHQREYFTGALKRSKVNAQLPWTCKTIKVTLHEYEFKVF